MEGDLSLPDIDLIKIFKNFKNNKCTILRQDQKMFLLMYFRDNYLLQSFFNGFMEGDLSLPDIDHTTFF